MSKKQTSIMKKIDESNLNNWRSWKWHMTHAVKDVETFESLLGIKLESSIREGFEETAKKFPMSITPYYLSLINTDDIINDPIFKQSFPVLDELFVQKTDMLDPLHEDEDSPVEAIVYRYPDRVLFLVSNMCAMYCRHCTRKRRVGDRDSIPGEE